MHCLRREVADRLAHRRCRSQPAVGRYPQLEVTPKRPGCSYCRGRRVVWGKNRRMSYHRSNRHQSKVLSHAYKEQTFPKLRHPIPCGVQKRIPNPITQIRKLCCDTSARFRPDTESIPGTFSMTSTRGLHDPSTSRKTPVEGVAWIAEESPGREAVELASSDPARTPGMAARRDDIWLLETLSNAAQNFRPSKVRLLVAAEDSGRLVSSGGPGGWSERSRPKAHQCQRRRQSCSPRLENPAQAHQPHRRGLRRRGASVLARPTGILERAVQLKEISRQLRPCLRVCRRCSITRLDFIPQVFQTATLDVSLLVQSLDSHYSERGLGRPRAGTKRSTH